MQRECGQMLFLEVSVGLLASELLAANCAEAIHNVWLRLLIFHGVA
jgi:hypothetical protein